MAYVNVKEWSVDQVLDWIKGLDNCLQQYLKNFLDNDVNGSKLLNLTSSDLDNLQISIICHHELFLEAVENLRHLHYELDRENLQNLALKLSCQAHVLNRKLKECDENSRLSTQTIFDVANLIKVIKTLITWLDKSPFSEQITYIEKKSVLISVTLKLVWNAKRDNFAEKPIGEIRRLCNDLAQFADKIIQESSDPMILQPAYLELVTLKKRNDDLGFLIAENYHGIHQITEIKFGSAAHNCGKIEDGDEIVQVNYQTVVGWQWQKVSMLFDESRSDVLLTIKKRPRHCKFFGQIYIKPYRLPSKKRMVPYSKWNDSIPSPRLDLLRVPDFEIPLTPKFPSIVKEDIASIKSNDSDSDSDNSIVECLDSFTPLKSRPLLRRRNTISGYSPTSKRSYHVMEKYWSDLKNQNMNKSTNDSFPLLIDKSISCDFGLEKTSLSNSSCICSQNFNKSDHLSSSEKQLNFNENPSTNQWRSEIIEEIIGSLKKNIITDTTNMNDSDRIIKKNKPKPAVPPRTSCTKLTSHKLEKNDNNFDTSNENKKSTILIPPSLKNDELVEKFLHDLIVPEDNKKKLEVDPNLKPLLNKKTVQDDDINKPILGSNKVSNIRLLSCNNGSTSIKKKNLLRNKRRRVAVKDLVPFDIQGYLYQRPNRSKNSQTINWKRRFFVLFNKALYGFREKNATKADFLIFLNGFTISTADEVKSKSNAFKIYHTGKVFYFAAESDEIMQIWLEQMLNVVHADILKPLDESLISETDDSDSEIRVKKKESLSTSNLKESTTCSSLKKFGSLKKFTSRKTAATDSSSSSSINESTSLDRKYLKFFHSSSTNSSNSSHRSKSPKSSSVPVPVPTAQFRSYRKVPTRNSEQG